MVYAEASAGTITVSHINSGVETSCGSLTFTSMSLESTSCDSTADSIQIQSTTTTLDTIWKVSIYSNVLPSLPTDVVLDPAFSLAPIDYMLLGGTE